MTTTTQDAFHPMRGHVADGVTVKMRNGDVVTIKAVMKGWQLYVGDIPHGITTPSALLHRAARWRLRNET